MNIIKNQTDKSLNIALEGRLDTTTAPELEAELKQSIGDSAELNLDFAKLVIRNDNDVISEVFEVTGFSDILTIE